MKKYFITLVLLMISSSMLGQTYKIHSVISSKAQSSLEFKEYVISITDKEISITNFIGGSITQYFIVNKIVENKDWGFDGICKTYYCTTKDKDVINGFQKAIIYKTFNEIILGLFADEITVYNYRFEIKR